MHVMAESKYAQVQAECIELSLLKLGALSYNTDKANLYDQMIIEILTYYQLQTIILMIIKTKKIVKRIICFVHNLINQKEVQL